MMTTKTTPSVPTGPSRTRVFSRGRKRTPCKFHKGWFNTTFMWVYLGDHLCEYMEVVGGSSGIHNKITDYEVKWRKIYEYV